MAEEYERNYVFITETFIIERKAVVSVCIDDDEHTLVLIDYAVGAQRQRLVATFATADHSRSFLLYFLGRARLPKDYALKCTVVTE
jgi:hypothetical protein